MSTDTAASCAATATDADIARRFGGVARLFGAPGYARIQAAHVVVVGVGGVGSWTAEALARSGVARLTLIDLDHIAESNTNRQIHALGDAYGQSKVEAMAQRIAAINPLSQVHCVEEFVDADNVSRLLPAGCASVVIDCIDQVRAKAALVAWCQSQALPVVVCGAAGGRLDPTRIRVDDLARASGDPLIAKLRYRLRRDYGFAREGARRPRFHVPAVFSDEQVQMPQATAAGQHAEQPPMNGLACAGYGSAVTVTAPLGFAAAAVALKQLSCRT